MHQKLIFFLLFASTALFSCAQEITNKEEQIGMAILAAPEDTRAGSTVLGYDGEGNLITLREGTNEMICITDNPDKGGFQVVCYHKDLEPFMARGRALKAEGKNGSEVFEIRENEAKAGTLKMPSQPTTLHVLSGSEAQYDHTTGTVAGANYRYVVYIPFATPESTGLPIKPIVPGGPWIMDPGTHKAHIMITPPPQAQ